MRTVRLLIRGSASPLSPHLGRRGDAQTHTHAHAHTSARALSRIRVHSRWPLISRTNQSRQSQKQFSRKRSDPLEKCKSVCRLEKLTIVFFPSLRLFSDAALLLRSQHFCRRVTNRRIKTNLEVTVASVTVASGVPPTLWGGPSIWQVLRMRGVLIDENHFAASKHIYRDEACVMSNSWRSFQKVWGFCGEMAPRLKLKLFIFGILNSGLQRPTQAWSFALLYLCDVLVLVVTSLCLLKA